MVNNGLQKVVIYEYKNKIGITNISNWGKLHYEEITNPKRILLTLVSINFLKYINTVSKCELYDILSDELDINTETIYSN